MTILLDIFISRNLLLGRPRQKLKLLSGESYSLILVTQSYMQKYK